MKDIEEKFLKHEVESVLVEYKKQVLLNLLDNEEIFKEQILNILKKIADKSVKEEYEVKLIDFSLLQVGLLNEKYEITVIAYNKELYASEGLFEIFSVDYIFTDLKNIKDSLYKKIKKYVGQIRPWIIDQYILQQVNEYNDYFIYFIVKFLKQWDEEESFLKMKKDDTLRVVYGNYKDLSQTVYYYNNYEKNQELMKKKIKNNKPTEFIFSDWRGANLSSLKFENRDITCMNLKKSYLHNCLFSSCKGIGINLKNSHLEKCYFKSCDLSECDISNADLENVIFENCNLKNINLKDTNLKKVYIINKNKINQIVSKKN